tara:strand:- start:515 stop:1282 length:768 start_codon:yes stop_codon:yes gene_type:complete
MNWKEIKNLIKEELQTEGTMSIDSTDGIGGGTGGPMGGGGTVKKPPSGGMVRTPKGKKLRKEASITAKDTNFNLRVGVNKNPTKLGIKIQFEPSSGIEMDRDSKNALEIALQENLNKSLVEYGIQVSKDTDIPRPNVIGFFIPLSQVKNLIVEALGGKTEDPVVPAPEPEVPDVPVVPAEPTAPAVPSPDKMVNEQIINEMRVRDLNEISKVVNKDDFYGFVNAGNNIVRTLEEGGRSVSEAKKYLSYLTKHNIM